MSIYILHTDLQLLTAVCCLKVMLISGGIHIYNSNVTFHDDTANVNLLARQLQLMVEQFIKFI